MAQSKSKPRVIKDFDKLDKEIQEHIAQLYPNGFAEHLITYTDPKTGLERFALPYETEDRYYMVRMDEYMDAQVDSGHAIDDFGKDDSDDLIDLGIDNMEKPSEIKIEEDDEEEDDEDDDIVNKNDFDDEDDEDEITDEIDDEEDDDDDEK